MFLNYSTSINKMVDKADNGTLIMLYGHIEERYDERLKRITELTKMSQLKFDKFIRTSVNITKENYDRCINKTDKKVRNVIRDEIHFNVGGAHIVIDLSLLVTGTVVSWSNRHPRRILDQYTNLVESGELKLYDNILSFETMMTTVRFANESLENFSRQPSVGNYNFPRRIYNISLQELVYIIEPMLNDNETKISKNMKNFLRMLNKSKKIKCNL